MSFQNNENQSAQTGGEQAASASFAALFRNFQYEYKSQRKLFGLPLVHIAIGRGKCAKGIIAVGLKAMGFVSVGFLSLGLFSFGMLAAGLLGLGLIGVGVGGFGAFALGFFSAGAISVGFLSFGAISVGVLSCGAVSVGQFAVGALAKGHYFACGDRANAMVALGISHADGSVYTYCRAAISTLFTGYNVPAVLSALDECNVPSGLHWVMRFALSLAGVK